MNDMISRSSLIQKIQQAQASLETGDDGKWEMNKKYHSGLAWAHRLVAEEPSVEKHGTWKIVFHFAPYQMCSACEFKMPMKAGEDAEEIGLYRYCPNCGTKMDGGDNDGLPLEDNGRSHEREAGGVGVEPLTDQH